MKAVNFRKVILMILLLTFNRISQCLNLNSKLRLLQSQKDNQHSTQQKEYQLEQQFKTAEEKQLDEWIVEQLRQNQQYPEVQPHQSVIFYLRPNVTHIYRIPASLNQKKLIEVSLFQVAADGQIVITQNPSVQNFVQVFTSDEKRDLQYKEGIVYISKIFQIKFTQTHKFLKFKNRAQTPFLVLLDMEEEQLFMELIVSDDQFELTRKKIQTILEESKNLESNRQHVYKWQWGFYEKHQRHQTDILGFTAVELLIIIGTSIVQMYCIKNVMDDEIII